MQVSQDEKKIISKDNFSENVKLATESIKHLLGNIPYQIILLLSQTEGMFYFKDIKKNLEEIINKSLTDQTIYYHLRKLKDLGFINHRTDQTVDENDRLINIQNYFLTSKKFIIDFTAKNEKQNNVRPKFFEYFNLRNKFNGFIVIGERSNDVPYIVPISFLLRKFFFLSDDLAFSDANIVDKHLYEENLILLGGPIVNNIHVLENNKVSNLLPVKFLELKDPGVLIQHSNEIILAKDRNIGVIQLIDNPWNKKKKILIIGGPRRLGTESAVFGITKNDNPIKIDKLLQTHQYCLVEPIFDGFNKMIDVKLSV